MSNLKAIRERHENYETATYDDRGELLKMVDKLEAQLAEKDQLLKEIIPLIPDFNFALERNPAIANYDYLKAAIKGEDDE